MKFETCICIVNRSTSWLIVYKLHINILQHIASYDSFICLNILDKNLRIFKSLLGVRLIFIFENMTKAWRYWSLLKQMYMYTFWIYCKFYYTNISIMSNDILLEIIQPRKKRNWHSCLSVSSFSVAIISIIIFLSL